MKHTMKSVLLLVGLAGFFMMIGHWVGGSSGMFIALLFSLAMNLGAYWYSDKMVLAMHKAEQIDASHASGVYQIVEELCAKASLPMPKVYITPEKLPNAFATGRNPENAAVAVTSGLLDILDYRELRGVLAHELGHVKNRDILISTIVASIASAVMYLAHMLQWFSIFGGRQEDEEGGMNPLAMLFTIIVAPFVALLIQMGVSRSREYMADETGAEISEDPEALASALHKISQPDFQREELRNHQSESQPSMSHLYIVNHLSKESLMSLFSTHPPVEKRISNLRLLKRKLQEI